MGFKMIINNDEAVISNINISINSYYKLKSFSDFWNNLKKLTNIYIIGGFVRDSFFNKKSRDLDVIIEDDNYIIDFLILKYNLKFQKNSYDGYKVYFDDFNIDIWSIKKHIYYKDNYFSNESELEKSCLLNIDSLIYDYTKSKLRTKIFKSSINNAVIDFISEDNEYLKLNNYKEQNITKIMHTVAKYDLAISDNIKSYINKFCNNYDDHISLLHKQQQKHFKKDLYSRLYITKFINNYVFN